MKAITVQRGSAEVAISEGELGLIVNALMHTIGTIPESEFADQMGVDLDTANRLIQDARRLLSHNAMKQAFD